MLGRGVGDRERAGDVRGNRAVVDDPAALWLLRLHRSECLLGAEETAGEVRVEDRLPLLDRELVQRRRCAEDAGVVEQQVNSCERIARPREQVPHSAGIGDVGRHDERVPRRDLEIAQRLLQHLSAAAGQDDAVAVAQQRSRDRPTDP